LGFFISRKWILLSSFSGAENGMILKNKPLDHVDPRAKVQEISIAVGNSFHDFDLVVCPFDRTVAVVDPQGIFDP
jgi:hypothetical protein